MLVHFNSITLTILIFMIFFPKSTKQIFPMIIPLIILLNFSLINGCFPINLSLANNNGLNINFMWFTSTIHNIKYMFIKILSINSIDRFNLTLIEWLYGYFLIFWFLFLFLFLTTAYLYQWWYFVFVPISTRCIFWIEFLFCEDFLSCK